MSYNILKNIKLYNDKINKFNSLKSHDFKIEYFRTHAEATCKNCTFCLWIEKVPKLTRLNYVPPITEDDDHYFWLSEGLSEKHNVGVIATDNISYKDYFCDTYKINKIIKDIIK